MSRLLRILTMVVGLLVAIVVGAAIVFAILNEDRPEGSKPAEAKALAQRIIKATGQEGWKKTGAIEWDFGGREQLLWDRNRGYARVRWDNIEVLLRISDQTGVATQGGQPVGGADKDALLKTAYSRFINDSFWLNPFEGLFDDSASLSIVDTPEGSEGLLITYSGGGVTPGDAYLWSLDAEGMPVSWKMWVNIIPIGGLSFTWEDWETLPTGAKVAKRHKGLFTLVLSDIKAGANLSDLTKDDPFDGLKTTAPPHPSSQPTQTATTAP